MAEGEIRAVEGADADTAKGLFAVDFADKSGFDGFDFSNIWYMGADAPNYGSS